MYMKYFEHCKILHSKTLIDIHINWYEKIWLHLAFVDLVDEIKLINGFTSIQPYMKNDIYLQEKCFWIANNQNFVQCTIL